MSMIEVTTDYGVAEFDSKTLAEGLRRAEDNKKRRKERPARRKTDKPNPKQKPNS